jgi:hypothetical protein
MIWPRTWRAFDGKNDPGLRRWVSVDEANNMTDGTTSSLQQEQAALMDRVKTEPDTATVMEALGRIYSQSPATFAVPTYVTTFGTGTTRG